MKKPTTRTSPPIIILKLDDLSQQYGAIVPKFVRIADLLDARSIKAGFGLICAVTWDGAQPLTESTPAYVDQVKAWHASGNFEIWFHGWDHGGHVVNGENCCEFYGRTYEDQLARFTRAQDVAQEVLGFHFTTFGAGGGISPYPIIDDATCRAVAAAPHINAWFQNPDTSDATRRLHAEGNVVFLDGCPGVKLEQGTGNPDYAAFRQGYDANPDHACFVLQGHPNTWDDAKFAEVLKVVDFLKGEDAVFMTPAEYVAVSGVTA